jgi:hypothetical protein
MPNNITHYYNGNTGVIKYISIILLKIYKKPELSKLQGAKRVFLSIQIYLFSSKPMAVAEAESGGNLGRQVCKVCRVDAI